MKLITYENIPCWYELSWQEKDKCLVVRVHKDVLTFLPELKPEHHIVSSFMKDFGAKSFVGNLNGNFGFDDVLLNRGQVDQFIQLEINLPKVKVFTNDPCGQCGGKGKHPHHPREKCFHCEGRGKEYDLKWEKAYLISASLTLLFMFLDFLEKETSATCSQLLTVGTHTTQGMHGGSLHGRYGIDFAKWFRTFPEGTELEEINHAMKCAHKQMYGSDQYSSHGCFFTKIQADGWLNISCPGDACGLDPSNYHRVGGEQGYEFSCHNVDTPMQQFTLLVALAALSDKARKEMKV